MSNAVRVNRSPEVDQYIFDGIANGKLMKTLAKELGCGIHTIAGWRNKDPLFEQHFMQARAIGFDLMAEDLLTILDKYPDPQAARVVSDNIKWCLAKWAGEKYGDKIDVNINNRVDISKALIDARVRKDQLRDITPEYTISATSSKDAVQPEKQSAAILEALADLL